MAVNNEYDELPMRFCRDCLWHGDTITINVNGNVIEYCPYCGCTTFKELPAYQWDELFQTKYRRPSFYKCKEHSWSEIYNNGISVEDATVIIKCGDKWKDLDIQ